MPTHSQLISILSITCHCIVFHHINDIASAAAGTHHHRHRPLFVAVYGVSDPSPRNRNLVPPRKAILVFPPPRSSHRHLGFFLHNILLARANRKPLNTRRGPLRKAFTNKRFRRAAYTTNLAIECATLHCSPVFAQTRRTPPWEAIKKKKKNIRGLGSKRSTCSSYLRFYVHTPRYFFAHPRPKCRRPPCPATKAHFLLPNHIMDPTPTSQVHGPSSTDHGPAIHSPQPQYKMDSPEFVDRSTTPEKAGRSSFSSIREDSCGPTQAFTATPISSLIQQFDNTSVISTDESPDHTRSPSPQTPDMTTEVQFVPPITKPNSKLQGTWFPADNFRGWKQINVKGKTASRSFGDLQALHMAWSTPPPPRKGRDRTPPGQAPIERLPLELLGAFFFFLSSSLQSLPSWGWLVVS